MTNEWERDKKGFREKYSFVYHADMIEKHLYEIPYEGQVHKCWLMVAVAESPAVFIGEAYQREDNAVHTEEEHIAADL